MREGAIRQNKNMAAEHFQKGAQQELPSKRSPGNKKAPESMLCHLAVFLNERSLGDKMPYKDDHEDRATIAPDKKALDEKGLGQTEQKGAV